MNKEFPLITAHAGCMNTSMNSIESVLEGVKAGADIVELDVNVTKDGIAVLFHNEQIETFAHQTVKISDLTFEELQNSRRNKIIRLEEALDVVQQHHMSINLDLKSLACLKPMAAAVKFRNMVDDVIISGCSKEHASYVKKSCPEFQLLLNADGNASTLAPSTYEDYIKATCRDAIAASCCGININYKDCREELLYYARLRCLPILIYTVDSVPEMEKFITLGVHSITTNAVNTLVALKTNFGKKGL